MSFPPRPDQVRVRPRLDWLDLSVARPPDGGVLGGAALAAVAMDIAVRAGGVGLGGALLVTVVVVVVLASGRASNRQARLAVALAPGFGLWMAVRTSPWLVIPDLVVVTGLLGLGVSLAGSSLLDLTIPGAAARAVQVVAHALSGPSYVIGAVRTMVPPRDPDRRVRTRALLRGMLIAAPLVIVLGILLASADAVFASLFRIDVDPPSVVTHALLLAAGAWAMGGLLRAASGGPVGGLPRVPRLGWVEAAVVLGLMNALFTAFAVAQLVALSEGGRRVIETRGLTYAEYARRGFFQLLAVAAITLAAVLVLRAVVDRSDRAIRRRFTILAELTVVLTLVIVFVAVRRLGLYADVFGFTMLRLYCTVFAWWIGVVFVLLGLLLAGVGRRRSWLPSAAVGVGLAGLLWLNAANPEAIVVKHNIAFADQTGRFDPAYVSGLSDDAVPTLVAALPDLDPVARSLVLARLCPPQPIEQKGWASYNLARDRGFESLASACADRP